MGKLILGPVVGGMTDSSANLWGRADGEGVLHAWIGRQPDLSDAALAGQSLPLRPQDGYCGVAPLRGLQPNTTYHYSFSLEARPPDPAGGPYNTFRTFPAKGKRASFNFVFGSCFLPPDGVSGRIFKQIEASRALEDLRFWLLIGDQIYADDYEHNGIDRIAVDVEDYREVYRYAWSRQELQNLFANLPAYMTLDDHEVEDDWRWTNAGRTRATIPIWNQVFRFLKGRPKEEREFPRRRVLAGLQAYWEHQAMHSAAFINPPPLNDEGLYDLDADRPGSLAYTFDCGAAAFFVLDTRTMRIRQSGGRVMLGEQQWQALEEWMQRVRADGFPVRFIVSSCAILYRMFVDIPADRWSGFRTDRERLFGLLQKYEMDGLYFLTGDLHSAHALRADLPLEGKEPLQIWEFCSTPFEQKSSFLTRLLYNPFPFKPLRNLKLRFTAAKNNFGIVRVVFPEGGAPSVLFEAYDMDGKNLGVGGGQTKGFGNSPEKGSS